jgi:hypothetical protein
LERRGRGLREEGMGVRGVGVGMGAEMEVGTEREEVWRVVLGVCQGGRIVREVQGVEFEQRFHLGRDSAT